MSRLGEWILRHLSREPDEGGNGGDEWERGRELHKICRRIPWFPAMIRGARVLDFGCGSGYQVARIAELGATEVVGLEIQEELRRKAGEVADRYGVRDRVAFYAMLPSELQGTFDVIVSQNSMEHFSEPVSVLETMKAALAPTGRAVVVFGPLWWHPYGAHMHYFTKVPWPQVWFDEATIMTVRSDYRDDGAESFEEVQGGLNRMTVGTFRQAVEQTGFEFDLFEVEATKDLDVLARVPGLRELVAKNVFAILRPEDAVR